MTSTLLSLVIPGAATLAALLAGTPQLAQGTVPGIVLKHQKISALEGGFSGISPSGHFGDGLTVLGDLDGDGMPELAVGQAQDDDTGLARGAVWILFLNPDATVRAEQKINELAGGFGGTLDDIDAFGSAVELLGDLDDDGVPDLAVGTPFDDDGGTNRGAVYVLFMRSDGTVKSEQKISDTTGGFGGGLFDSSFFGHGLAGLGDLDGDGVEDLAVGAENRKVKGAFFVLFLKTDGTVAREVLIAEGEGGFSSTLSFIGDFGHSLAAIGDRDGDGVVDLAVGAPGDDDGGTGRGAVWLVHLRRDGRVKSESKISASSGGFGGSLDDTDNFGGGITPIGDVDRDGVHDLAVGALHDDDGGFTTGADHGAVWLLFLNADGTVRDQGKLSDKAGGFVGDLGQLDEFGEALANLGDLDGNGVDELVVGTPGHDDGGAPNNGAVFTLFLGDAPAASVATRNGSGINTPCLAAAAPPILDTVWSASVDNSRHPGATTTFLLAYADPLSPGILSIYGEVLVLPETLGGTLLLSDVRTVFAGLTFHPLALPDDPGLAGLPVYLQAGILGGGAELCNALDVVLGY